MNTTLTKKTQAAQDCLDYTLFSWAAQGNLNPIDVSHGKGVYFWDTNGKKYIDFSSQLICVNIGHGHPKVAEAVTKQMSKISFVSPSMATEVRGKLGKKLAEIAPGRLTKSFFTLGGADAIENAIKAARLYTGRHKILAQYRSYHGATYGAMAAGGDPRRHLVDSQAMPNVVHFENPYFYRCPWDSETAEECGRKAAENLERIIRYENPNNVAAILLEGESGTSGCIKYPPNYWKLVKEIADKYGILTICDEVMSGFGRTGEWFGATYHGVEPDMICAAKGLTSAYVPLGALIVTDEIAAFFDDHYMPLGLTYSAHAVSCAAALAVLQVYEDENLLENTKKMGKYMEQQVAKLKEKHLSLGDFRNTGLLGCIEVVKNRETKEPIAPWNGSGKEMEISNRMAAKIRELGMFTFVKWSYIFVAPPLCVTEAEIDEGLAIISAALSIADEYYEG